MLGNSNKDVVYKLNKYLYKLKHTNNNTNKKQYVNKMSMYCQFGGVSPSLLKLQQSIGQLSDALNQNQQVFREKIRTIGEENESFRKEINEFKKTIEDNKAIIDDANKQKIELESKIQQIESETSIFKTQSESDKQKIEKLTNEIEQKNSQIENLTQLNEELTKTNVELGDKLEKLNQQFDAMMKEKISANVTNPVLYTNVKTSINEIIELLVPNENLNDIIDSNNILNFVDLKTYLDGVNNKIKINNNKLINIVNDRIRILEGKIENLNQLIQSDTNNTSGEESKEEPYVPLYKEQIGKMQTIVADLKSKLVKMNLSQDILNDLFDDFNQRIDFMEKGFNKYTENKNEIINLDNKVVNDTHKINILTDQIEKNMKDVEEEIKTPELNATNINQSEETKSESNTNVPTQNDEQEKQQLIGNINENLEKINKISEQIDTLSTRAMNYNTSKGSNKNRLNTVPIIRYKQQIINFNTKKNDNVSNLNIEQLKDYDNYITNVLNELSTFNTNTEISHIITKTNTKF